MVVSLASLFRVVPRISYCSSVSFNASNSLLWCAFPNSCRQELWQELVDKFICTCLAPKLRVIPPSGVHCPRPVYSYFFIRWPDTFFYHEQYPEIIPGEVVFKYRHSILFPLTWHLDQRLDHPRSNTPARPRSARYFTRRHANSSLTSLPRRREVFQTLQSTPSNILDALNELTFRQRHVSWRIGHTSKCRNYWPPRNICKSIYSSWICQLMMD